MKRTVLLGLTVAAMNAVAVPINITVDATGSLMNGSGVATKAQYDQGNNNPASNLEFLKDVIANWTGASLTPVLPAAGSLVAQQDSLGGGGSYDGSAYVGYNYAVIHYGAGNAGGKDGGKGGDKGGDKGGGKDEDKGGGWWQAWYLGGQALNLAAVPQVSGQNVGGFSSIRYYGTFTPDPGPGPGPVPTPDAGSSLAMLGLALMGFSLVRRRVA